MGTLRGVLRWFFFSLVCVLFVAYVLYQSRLLVGGPRLTLSPEPPAYVSEPFVMIEGTAENIVRITINDRTVETSGEGYFAEQVMLTPGYSIIKLEAYDRYGRMEQLIRTVVHTPLTPVIELNQPLYGNEESSEEGG